MVIRWQINFQSVKGNSYVLSVYDANADSATVTQLIGSARPFTTQEADDDDYYTAIRTHSGYIRFKVTDDQSDILDEIMPSQVTDRPVVLQGSDGSVLWIGFITGEQYSQPWAPRPYDIELPVTSVFGAMDGVDLPQDDGYTSMQTLIDLANNYLPVKMSVIAPSTLPVSTLVVSNDNFREYLSEEDREDNNTTNTYSVITIAQAMEYFCEYFGISLREYHGNVYMLEHDTTAYLLNEAATSTPTATDLISNFQIRSASNEMGFAKSYKYVRGEFDTGGSENSTEDFYSSNDLSEKLTVKRRDRSILEYADSDEIKNLLPESDDGDYVIDDDNNGYYPQEQCAVFYRPGQAYTTAYGSLADRYYYTTSDGGTASVVGKRTTGDSDIMQITTAISTNSQQTAIRITCPERILILPDEQTLINIDFNASAIAERFRRTSSASGGTTGGGGTFGGGSTTESTDTNDTEKSRKVDITRGSIYMSIKIGDYYLSVSDSAATWTTTETVIAVPMYDESHPHLNVFETESDVDVYINNTNKGIFLSLPSSLRGENVTIVITFYTGIGNLNQTSSTTEFATRTYPGVLTGSDSDNNPGEDYDADYLHLQLTDFKIQKVYKRSVEDSNTDYSQNVYIISNANTSPYHCNVASTMTTRQANQNGTGLTLNSSDHSYCTTQYDLQGVERRAEVYAKNRPTIKVTVDKTVPPYDSITWHSTKFAILSQSMDWADDDNEMKLINIE